MRPVLVDVLAFLAPLVVGGGLFRCGRPFRRWHIAARGAALLVSLGVIAAAILSANRALPDVVELWAFRAGGLTTLACGVALFLLGVVWGVPNRSLSSAFLLVLAGVCLVVIGIEASGRLWWRFGAPELWGRTVNKQGLLQQSNGVTCSPTAAVMLLNLHGIAAGEGEMAYLADTTVLGTDAHGMKRALETKVASLGWQVKAGPTTYEDCVNRGEPFLAHVAGQYLGHAVTVARIIPEGVIILDPGTGEPRAFAAADFRREWDGIAIRIVK